VPEDLQDEKNLTFLYRAPKITLPSLNLTAIASVPRPSTRRQTGASCTAAFLTVIAADVTVYESEHREIHL